MGDTDVQSTARTLKRSPWVAWVGSRCRHRGLWKREAEGRLTPGEGDGRAAGLGCEGAGPEGWTEAAASQGAPAAAGSWKTRSRLPVGASVMDLEQPTPGREASALPGGSGVGRGGLVPGQGRGRETHGGWSSSSLQPAVTELWESPAHTSLGLLRSASRLVSSDASPVRPPPPADEAPRSEVALLPPSHPPPLSPSPSPHVRSESGCWG